MNSLKISSVLITLFWGLFCGIIVISIGIGAVFPPLNQIARPFVCPDGQLQVNDETLSPAPGTTTTIINWFCVDSKTGVVNEVNDFAIIFPAGTIYGLTIFAIALLWQAVYSHKSPKNLRNWQGADTRETVASFNSKISTGESDAARLKKLKELFDAGLITQQDYEIKKAEILNRL